MALPLLNTNPKYELTIPSTGQKVKFRPYLVKEQKVLLLAAESKDKTQILTSIIDTIEACVDGVNVYDLAIFDVDYIFTQIRAKSTGEKIDAQFSCSECSTPNDTQIDLEKINIDVPEKNDIIEMTDRISIKMKYPTYERFLKSNIFDVDTKTAMIMEIIICSIDSVMTDDENIKLADEPREAIIEFVESMTAEQFSKASAFIEDMPAIKHDIAFKCVSCGHNNTAVLEGIDDFF